MMVTLAARHDAAADTVRVSLTGPNGSSGKPITEEMLALAKVATERFRDACPKLLKSGDVVAIRISVDDDTNLMAYNYRGEAFGWPSELELQVDVGQQAKTLREAAGHTLYYFLGGGRRPGIATLKDQSATACGWKPNRGQAFTDDPGMRAVDKLAR